MESLSSALSHLEDCPSEQCPQFIVEEVEAQREKMSCLRLHSKLKARYPAQLSGFFLDPTAWRSFPKTNSIRLLLSTLINRRQGHESLQNKMWYLGEKENSLPNTPALQPRAMKPQKHFPVSQALGFFSAEVPCWKCQGHPSRSHQHGRCLASWPTLGSAPTAGGTSVFQYSHVFPQSNWLALSPSISPLPFHLFYFYFSSQALLFLYFLLLQWPSYRPPCFSLLVSRLALLSTALFLSCLCSPGPLSRMPFLSVHCDSPRDASLSLRDLNFDLYC